MATSPQPQQEQRAGEVVIPGIINDDDESFPAPSPFLPTQNGIDQAQEITRKVAEEMHGITHIPAISSPSLGSPLAAATPATVEHTALTPEDKLSHFCAMAREHREQQQQQQQQHHHHHHHHHQEVQHQAEQKGLIFEGEHFYFFDLLNADILTQTGLFGADVTTKMSDATSLIFSHNDVNKQTNINKHLCLNNNIFIQSFTFSLFFSHYLITFIFIFIIFGWYLH